jgi:hypothetical protein
MATTSTADTSVLVKISKSNGTSQAEMLDSSSTLATVRTLLGAKHLMSINDSFLMDTGTVVDRDQEGTIHLDSVLKDDVLLIGQPTDTSPIGTGDGVARYNLLNSDQKLAVFDNIQIFRGLTFGPNTFGKAFKDVYSWAPGYTPVANTPQVITELVSSYAFSKVTSDLKTYSSDSTSVSLSTPYASGEAEYKTEQSQSTSTSKVTEYLTTKYIVRKADLQVDTGKLVVSPDFIAAVRTALLHNEQTAEGYFNLINVLNTYGYYVPVEFTLGGAIVGSDQTEISDFSQAESEKSEFNASFKGEFEGIGGGAAYGQASGQDKATSTSTKYQDLTILVMGGDPGLEKDYPKWAASLNSALNWVLADVSKFWPTLLLLVSDEEGRQLLGTAINLIESFHSAPHSSSLQPYLDMGSYNTVIQAAVNPFA